MKRRASRRSGKTAGPFGPLETFVEGGREKTEIGSVDGDSRRTRLYRERRGSNANAAHRAEATVGMKLRHRTTFRLVAGRRAMLVRMMAEVFAGCLRLMLAIGTDRRPGDLERYGEQEKDEKEPLHRGEIVVTTAFSGNRL